MPGKLPLVSCVMPTGGRPELLGQALRCFGAQSYPNRELIVVDDSADPEPPTLPENVRLLRPARPASLGAKLNLGFAAARGDVFQKLDDDDWYAPRFLEIAVSALLSGEDPRTVAAWDRFLVLLRGETTLRDSGSGWLAGGSFCFRRELGQSAPFRDVSRSEDRLFLEDSGARTIRVFEPEAYVVLRHGHNTWQQTRRGLSVDENMRRKPVYPKTLEELMGAEDAAFYRRWTAR